MERLVTIAPEGGLVVDLFVGSGTTCMGALRQRTFRTQRKRSSSKKAVLTSEKCGRTDDDPVRPVPPEFPFEAVRDLVAILRVLYAEELRKKHPNKRKLATSHPVAEGLQRSVKVAAGHDVGTAPQRKALVMAEAATKRLAEIFTNEFGFPEEVPELVTTAVLRVRGEWQRRKARPHSVVPSDPSTPWQTSFPVNRVSPPRSPLSMACVKSCPPSRHEESKQGSTFRPKHRRPDAFALSGGRSKS